MLSRSRNGGNFASGGGGARASQLSCLSRLHNYRRGSGAKVARPPKLPLTASIISYFGQFVTCYCQWSPIVSQIAGAIVIESLAHSDSGRLLVFGNGK